MTEITKSAFARLKGVSPTAIDKAIEAKTILKGWNPVTRKIIQEIAEKEYTPQVNNTTIAAPETIHVDKPVKGPSRKVDDSKADDIEDEFLEGEGLKPEDLKVTKEDSYNTAKTKHTKIQFLLDKQKLQKEAGQLLPKDKVQSTLYTFGNNIRRYLENMPQRITPDIRAASTEAEAILIFQKELKAALEKIAAGVDFATNED